MNSYLRQSTAAQSRALGPFIDDTDFKTAETALTIANTDIKLVANGGASANKNSGGGTHRVNGVYGVTFDATDTATVGELYVSVVVAGALPVFHVFVVLEEAVYDALLAASAPGYLQPTTAGRTLDVSATGEAGIDLANVGSPATVLNLSGTTVAAVSGAVGSVTGNVGGNVNGSVASVAGSVASVTGNVGGNVVGNVNGSVASVTGNVGGNVVGSVASVAGAVASVTGNVGGNVNGSVGSVAGNVSGNVNGSVASVTGAVASVTGNVGGNVNGSVGSVVAPVTAGTVSDKTGYRLSVTGVDDVLDDPVEGAITVRQSLRLANAANAGKLSGAATTAVAIRDLADAKNRITATVDADGNRTAVAIDVT